MNKKGFTIVELLTVVVIIGIIATIAIVSVTKEKNNAVDKQIKALSSTIESAFQIYRLDNKVNENQTITLDKLSFNREISYDGKSCDDLSQSYVKFVRKNRVDNNNSKEEVYCVYLYCNGEEVINDFISNEAYCKNN